MAKHVEPYVKATSDFFSSLGAMPDVVDLGCGDFNVGSRLRPFCAKYVACDVAAPVVEANRKRFAGLDVEFRQLDIIESELPPGDVVIIRQVLQHLSNADIRKIVPKLYNYKYVVLAEVIPAREFVPNLDQPTGVSSRMARGLVSGVVLTEPPFLLRAKAERVLCVSYDEDSLGSLVTTLYEFG
jgi:SAM-dependent methyltransferase